MRTLSFRRSDRQRNTGFSLIEVLVSIVVLSFGLLGMVGLQAASLQANRDARLQSTAILLARDIAEAMRGNKAVAVDPTVTSPYLGEFQSTGSNPLVPTVASYCLNVGQNCANPTATANAQMTEWLARVSYELPGARVSICKDSAPYDPTSGLPRWVCSSTSTTDIVVVKIGWTRAKFRHGSATDSLDRADQPSVMLPVTPGSTL
ncbi:MAG: type IV pilus modification protein PilV [Janthinobacterium lividum]